MSLYVNVAVARPLDELYTYIWPTHLGPSVGDPVVGACIEVPFAGRQTLGIVVEVLDAAAVQSSGFDVSKIKTVTQVFERRTYLTQETIALARQLSDLYLAPLGELLSASMMPKPDHPYRDKKSQAVPEAQVPQLSLGQNQALEQILNAGDNPVLLEGVTGSGKTEIYIHLARRALAENKSVLILMPEIALTAQLRLRFERGIGQTIRVWHSAVATGERQRHWLAAQCADKPVVILGARSAVFIPIANLGLIIVDEEHDSTYKQEERVRYHGRDVALLRAKKENSKIVLGSATPSLESVRAVQEGRWTRVPLTERYQSRPLPEWCIVDLKTEPTVGKTKSVFAEKTVQMMREVLAGGDQIILYLNRRGFSQRLQCRSCGEVIFCDQCSVSLVHYRSHHRLKCHYCGLTQPEPKTCPKCQSHELMGLGAGTESLEQDLAVLFPGVSVLRLDRDQVTSQQRLEETLGAFRRGEAQILVGTQMVVKGHDFPGVTLVVVPDLDGIVSWPDFRSNERALQTLIQVAGRAGRGQKPGRVVVQGYDTDHIVLAVAQGKTPLTQFLSEESALRAELKYPPYSKMARFRVEHEDGDTAKSFLEYVAFSVRKSFDLPDVQCLGPTEALIAQVKGKKRFDLLVKCARWNDLYRIGKKVKALAKEKRHAIVIDVDPYSV